MTEPTPTEQRLLEVIQQASRELRGAGTIEIRLHPQQFPRISLVHRREWVELTEGGAPYLAGLRADAAASRAARRRQ